MRVCSAGQASLPLVSSSSMVVLVLSEDSCQREEEGSGEEGLAVGGAGVGDLAAWLPGDSLGSVASQAMRSRYLIQTLPDPSV